MEEIIFHLLATGPAFIFEEGDTWALQRHLRVIMQWHRQRLPPYLKLRLVQSREGILCVVSQLAILSILFEKCVLFSLRVINWKLLLKFKLDVRFTRSRLLGNKKWTKFSPKHYYSFLFVRFPRRIVLPSLLLFLQLRLLKTLVKLIWAINP